MPRGKSASGPRQASIRIRTGADDRLDALIEAQTKFVAALTEVAVKLANPMALAAPATAAMRPWDEYQRDITSEQARRLVPRGTTMGADAAALNGAMAQDFAREVSAQPPDETVEYAPGDILSDMAEELASYQDDEDALPPADPDAVWRKRLQLLAIRLWQPEWGPRPGQEGCKVPQHLLNGRG